MPRVNLPSALLANSINKSLKMPLLLLATLTLMLSSPIALQLPYHLSSYNSISQTWISYPKLNLFQCVCPSPCAAVQFTQTGYWSCFSWEWLKRFHVTVEFDHCWSMNQRWLFVEHCTRFCNSCLSSTDKYLRIIRRKKYKFTHCNKSILTMISFHDSKSKLHECLFKWLISCLSNQNDVT